MPGDLIEPVARVVFRVVVSVLWELFLHGFFWHGVCGPVGWFTLRIVTLGKQPEIPFRDSWNENRASILGCFVGLVVLVASVTLSWLLWA